MSVLIQPIITEKSLTLAGRGQYTFMVDPRANAPRVAEAVAEQFGVKVIAVRIIRITGATRSFRFHFGRTNAIKKAIVSVKKGQSIAGFSADTKEDDKKPKTDDRQDSKAEKTKNTEAAPTPAGRGSDRSIGETK